MANKEISADTNILVKKSLLIILDKVRKLHRRVLEPKEDSLILLSDHLSKVKLDRKNHKADYPKRRIKFLSNTIIEDKRDVKKLRATIQYLNELEDSIKESLAA